MSETNDNKDIVTLDSELVDFAIYSADDDSLTFYADESIPSVGSKYNRKTATNIYTGLETAVYSSETEVPWYSVRDNIKTVRIDESFKNVSIVSTSFWFCYMGNCTSMDLLNLNTSEVTQMQQMFRSCTSLTSLDLSGFDMSNVERISNMLNGSSSLETLDICGWETGSILYMNAFCYNCSSLKTIYADRDFTVSSNISNEANMFYWCSSLVGGNGTKFNSSSLTSNMAHIDTSSSPGYFTGKGVFAVYSTTDESLTFCNNIVNSSDGLFSGKDITNIYTGFATTVYSSASQIPWYPIRTNIKSANFDESFADIRPVAMAWWFYEMTELVSVDATYLDMSENTTMEEMFWNCASLAKLDVSEWNVGNVTNMHNAFSGMEKVECLDVSKWDVGNVTTMYGIFYNCKLLNNIPVENWETTNLTDMNGMFDSCSGLTSIDITGFDTSKVIDMQNSFRKCSSLKFLNVSNFDTSNVIDMRYMFEDCQALETIYSNDDNFVTSAVTNGNGVFASCYSLMGGNGTKYSSDDVSYTMAHVDVESNPGYFTEYRPKDYKSFSIYSADDDSLTFYYDDINTIGESYNGKSVTDLYIDFCDTKYTADSIPWNQIRENVVYVIIDSSFKSVKPVDTDYWFYNFENCTKFKNLSNINTGEIESMSNMFGNCSEVTYLDLSGWDTSNVTDMSYMFQYFNGFYIETSSFNTSKVKDFQQMFACSPNIICLDVSNFDVSSAQNIEGMFRQMDNLVELTLGGWDIRNVTIASNLFRDSQSLETIRAFNDWNLDITKSGILGECITGKAIVGVETLNDDNMFYNCQSLVGGNGTEYDPDRITGEMAKVDRKGTEGYFTKNTNCFCDPISYLAISKDSKKSLAAIRNKTIEVYFGISLDPDSYPSVDNTRASLLGIAKLGTAVLGCYDFWTKKILQVQDNEYLWMRLLITNKDGIKEWSEPWLLTI